MVQEIVKQWDKNKHKLENYFKTTEQGEYCGSYEYILKKVIELVLNDEGGNSWERYDASNLHTIDDGDYQGTLVFLFPRETYQPSIEDYIITYVSYGSCSGCNTLQAISNYEDGIATDDQVKDYMMLALHLIQNMKKFND